MFSVETLVVQDGKTPLQLAEENCYQETVKLLESYLQEVPTVATECMYVIT